MWSPSAVVAGKVPTETPTSTSRNVRGAAGGRRGSDTIALAAWTRNANAAVAVVTLTIITSTITIVVDIAITICSGSIRCSIDRRRRIRRSGSRRSTLPPTPRTLVEYETDQAGRQDEEGNANRQQKGSGK